MKSNKNSIPVEVTKIRKSVDSQSIIIYNTDYRQTFFNCRQLGLVMPNTQKDIHNYKTAKLVKGSKNNVPTYYVEFSAFNALTGKLQRKRLYTINEIENLTQREIQGFKLVNEINELLNNGFHFNDTRLKNETYLQTKNTNNKYYTLETGLKKALEIKKSDLSKRSYYNYSSSLERFLIFSDNYSLRHTDITKLEKDFAYNLLDYLTGKNTLQGQTINSFITQIRSLFSTLLERNIIKTNIFQGLKKQKEITTNRNIAYNPQQIIKIKEHLIKKDLLLWRFCQVIFYTFARPNEIRQIEIQNIDLEKNLIYLSAAKSKTKRERFIYISKPLKEIFIEMNIQNQPKTNLLFYLNKENPNKIIGTNTLADRYRKELDFLKFDKCYTMYSWKHTGNVTSYKNGIDIYSIMKQNGHTSIDTTMKYLKTLGLIIDTDFTNKFDKITI